MGPSLWFLHVGSTYSIILGEARSLSTIRSVTTFSKILKFTIIRLTSTNLLNISLRMINSSIWFMVTASWSTNLIRAIPLISGSSKAVNLIILHISCFICHSSYGLRNVVWTHRWILGAANTTIVWIKIDLIHITDATLSYLVFGRHRYVTSFICLISVLWVQHLLHLRVSVVVWSKKLCLKILKLIMHD